MTNSLPTRFIFFLIILVLPSCKSESNEKNLARFKDTYLNESDIINEIPITLNQKDSAIFTDNYIHKWLVNQMIMDKSEEMIPMEVLKVEKKINKYKMSLISYEFEQFYINKRLDTSISKFQISKYYENHLDDFVLNDYAVKCMYLQVPKKSKFFKEIKKNYHLKNEDMIDKIMEIGQNEEVSLYYNPEEWVLFDDLMKQIPILEKYSKIEFIKKKKKVILDFNNYIYFINVYDFIIKNGISPLSFEENKIKSIILNQRAKNLRKKLRQDLYNDGIKNNLIDKIRQ